MNKYANYETISDIIYIIPPEKKKKIKDRGKARKVKSFKIED